MFRKHERLILSRVLTVRTVNTQTSELWAIQMRAADVSQALLVLSEATLREAKSGAALIMRVGFLQSKNKISTKGIFVTGLLTVKQL